MIALVIFVAIKAPHAAHDDEGADSVVPKIAEKMETEVGTAGGAFKSDVVENHQFRHRRIMHRRVGLPELRGAGMITQRANFPFRVDDTAILWRQLGLGYFHKRISFGNLTRP